MNDEENIMNDEENVMIDREKINFYFGVINNSFVEETYLRDLNERLDRLDSSASDVNRANLILDRLDRIEGELYGDDIQDLMVTDIRGIKLNYQKKMLHLYQLGYQAIQDLEIVVGHPSFNNKYAKLRSKASFRSA